MYKKYCLTCKKITDYKLDTTIGHSYCTVCGFAHGVKLNKGVREIIKELIKHKVSEKKLKEYKTPEKNCIAKRACIKRYTHLLEEKWDL